MVKELLDGEKGKKMREKVKEWQCLAEGATKHKHGSSIVNLEMVISKLLLGQRDGSINK